MPRLPRIRIAGFTLHVIHRGNNRNLVFFGEQDYRAYISSLRRISERYETRVHAYVLMTNHVHLLMTSDRSDGISRTMQHVAASYTRRINERHGRTGTLWQARFKSSPVETERYCLACYRYIELNPVRAGLVQDPAGYQWSSYHENSGKRRFDVVQPHSCYLDLAKADSDRFTRYRALVREDLPDKTILEIRAGSAKGLPVGSAEFRSRVESALGTRLGSRELGRPKRREKSVSAPDPVSSETGSDTN